MNMKMKETEEAKDRQYQMTLTALADVSYLVSALYNEDRVSFRSAQAPREEIESYVRDLQCELDAFCNLY